MSARKRRVLVVDSSVMHSAGETDHPVSSACRECLEAILLICHRVAVTAAIRQEWKRHSSRFARKWRLFMSHKRKILDDKDVVPKSVPLDLDRYADSDREEIEKDICFIEAALATERIIVTRDDSLKVALGRRPDGAKLLKSIKWINPVADGVRAIEAL